MLAAALVLDHSGRFRSHSAVAPALAPRRAWGPFRSRSRFARGKRTSRAAIAFTVSAGLDPAIGLATIHKSGSVGASDPMAGKTIVVIVLRDPSRGPHPAATEATGSVVRRMPGRSTAASGWGTFDLTTPFRAVARSKVDAVQSERNTHNRKNHRSGIRPHPQRGYETGTSGLARGHPRRLDQGRIARIHGRFVAPERPRHPTVAGSHPGGRRVESD